MRVLLFNNQSATEHFLANFDSNVNVPSTPEQQDDDTNIHIVVFMPAMSQKKKTHSKKE